MKSRLTKALAVVMSVCLVISAFAASSVASADGYDSQVMLNFSSDKASTGNAIGNLQYSNGSLTLKSNGVAQNYSKGEYITQTFTLGASAQDAVNAVRADRAHKRIATDVTLSQCICRAVNAVTAWDVKSIEVQLMVYGSGLVTKSSVYLAEGETGRVIIDLPPDMTSVDKLVIKFENNISNMDFEKSGYEKAGPKDITATFTPLKVYNVDNGTASSNGAAGCIFDWSQTDAYSMLGSGPLVQQAKIKYNHNASIFKPVGALQVVSDSSLVGWHPDTWEWEDTGVKLYPTQGSFKGYDGMSMYIYVEADEAFYKWDYPDWSSAPVSISASAKVPARDADGNFVSEDWEIVDTPEEAYADTAYFKMKSDIQVQGEKTVVSGDKKIVAGKVYTLTVKFSDMILTQPWPEIDMWWWDSLADESPYGGICADYLKTLSIGRGTMANDCYVNYYISDIYGVKGSTSYLPPIGSPDPTTKPTTTTTTPKPTITTTPTPSKKGDVTGDGTINIQDVQALLAIVTGNKPCDLAVCDILVDGTVNIQDVSALLNIVLK